MPQSSDSLSAEETAAFQQSVDQVRGAAVRYLIDKRGSPLAITFVHTLQNGIDQVVSKAIHQGAPLACKPGCSYCCSARVEAIAPEIFRIVREITSRPTEEMNMLKECLKSYAAKPDAVASWAQRMPCPFLIDHLCSIYEVRPGVCRKAHSLDAKKCESCSPEIPQSLNIVLGADALMKGTSDAYSEVGLHSARYDLGRAVLIALSDPDAETRWLRGEAIFG